MTDNKVYIDDIFYLGEKTGGGLTETGEEKPEKVCENIKKYIRNIKKYTQDTQQPDKSEAGQWLKDNWYIAENAAQDAENFFKRSPKLQKSGKDFAVIAAGRTLIEFTDCVVSEEIIKAFLSGLQKKRQVTEGELYSFIPAVMMALLERLSAECKETAGKDENIFKNIFTSLRFLDDFDGSELIESVNRLEGILRQDPAGIYKKMDKRTRHLYRVKVSQIAAKEKISEIEAANKILNLSKENREHIGKFIFERPLGKEKKENSGGMYISGIILGTVFISALLGIASGSFLTAFLSLLPSSEIVKSITDSIVLKIKSPSYLPRLELKDGIPANAKTVCVLSSVLLSRESISANIKSLENMSITNRDSGENLMFAVLADLPEADKKLSDDDLRLMKFASDEIKALNEIDDRFYFFVRRREFNQSSGKYLGYERKRGAILNLVKYLSGEKNEIICLCGDEEKVKGSAFIIALDSDTKIYAGEAKELVGAALHPLNRPEVDVKKGCVVKGAGIIQPKISVSLEAASKTQFSKFFAGLGGADPYGSLSSDVYQDLFGYGSFNGKGLINVPVYKMCLSDAFPENTVLSHDILEGAYLKTKYAGDIDFSDGYPEKVLSYYSRMHRWIRGDWQNMPWLKDYIKDGKLITRKNPLSDIDKWKIFDNMRRSLVSPGIFFSIIAGALSPGKYWLAMTLALFCLFWEMIFSSLHQLMRRPQEEKIKYHSQIIYGPRAILVQTISKFILLPYEAFVCVSAAVTAIYRMKVSRRNMLSWVTSAESEKKSGNALLEYFRKMIVCPIIGLGIFVISGNYFGAFLFAVYAATPAFAYVISVKDNYKNELTFDQKKYLESQAKLIWGYFEDTLNSENSFLPPDNIQIDPPIGTAHRTSPTNIGLALLSCLASEDLGIIKKGEGIALAEKTIDTVLKMEKWNGHLYNWYDTENLSVLEPRYVSTVDSGNFLGCLIAFSEELKEREESNLLEKVTKIIDDMDFCPLYDKKKELFYIGWDVDNGGPTNNHYDLMESEARQTSYIATAKGTAPKEHWKKLSRMLSTDGQYRGMVSWTGTAFEYFMPDMLLPETKNSLSYETGRYCLYAQMKKAGNRPWGTSESCLYEFDSSMSYKYAPHGVQSLALKRDMDNEYVVSPYSSFLALMIDPKEAIKNLEKLERTGCTGKYGFYEAVDYTPSRCGQSEYKIAKTFMAHHLGMSMVSIANAVMENIMKKRFIKNREMGAYTELTAEKLPIGETVVRNRIKDVPDRQNRYKEGVKKMEVKKISYSKPYVFPLSNGSYTTAISETGQTKSIWNDFLIARCAGDEFEDGGIDFKVKIGNKVYGLHPVSGENYEGYSIRYDGQQVYEKFEDEEIKITLETKVFENFIGEKKTIKVVNKTEKPLEGEIRFYFEPVLQRQQDFQSHPGFSKLQIEYRKKSNCIIASRRGDDGKPVMGICFISDMDTRFSTSRLKSFGRGNPYETVPEKFEECFHSAGQEGCVAGATFVELEPGKEAEVCYALSAGFDDDSIYSSAVDLLNCKDKGCYLNSDSDEDDLFDCVKLLSKVFYGREKIPNYNFDPNIKRPKNDLWEFGISGDIPLIAYNYKGGTSELYKVLRVKKILSKIGINFDLAVLSFNDESDSQIKDYIRRTRLENSFGKSGGVFTISYEKADAVLDLAFYMIDEETFSDSRQQTPKPKFKYKRTDLSGKLPDYRFTDENEFEFTVRGRLPETVWSDVLSNERFGTIAADNGCGFMWNINSHENKINSWNNDRFAFCPSEKIEIDIGGNRYSVFGDEDGIECKVTFGFGYARWEKKIEGAVITTTMFIPIEKEAKVIIIRGERVPADTKIWYYTDLIMADRYSDSRYIVTDYYDGTIKAYNRTNNRFSAFPFSFKSSSELCGFTMSKASFILGKMDGFVGTGEYPCIGAVTDFSGLQIFSMGCDTDETLQNYLSADFSEKSLEDTKAWWREKVSKVKVDTGNGRLDHFINGWGMYQTIACRIFGRTSVYQNGGAFGFRDQLQDGENALYADPNILAQQILRCCSHQFVEGDVQHWWHPWAGNEEGTEPGVRTLCSDDYLWLAYEVCNYYEATGDRSLIDTNVYYIESQKPSLDSPVIYEVPMRSRIKETVFDHAVKCLNLLVSRGFGEHGLCKILGGDWNDGMDLVGKEGKGESVWLTFFASVVFTKMADLSEKLDMKIMSENCRFTAKVLRDNAERAYNGSWFIRGYWDSGEKLGAPGSGECEIDSISQSFAQFAGADVIKTKTALFNAYNKLTDEDYGIVSLFLPPFDSSKSKPGYIKRYAPGIRENGGQYTHAALWMSKALFETGEPEYGYRILDFVLPEKIERYKAEPFVVAADVYTNKSNFGRAGWTWYTASGGLLYKVLLENLLGLKIRDGRLYIDPNLPKDVPEYKAEVNIGRQCLKIEAIKGNTKPQIKVNGEEYNEEGYDLFENEKYSFNNGKI